MRDGWGMKLLRSVFFETPAGCDSQVEGCGDLDVFAVAGDKGDGMSEAFHNGSIVGEEVGVRLLISLAKQRGRKDLRGLDKSVVGTGNSDALAVHEVANGLHHLNHRHDGFGTRSFFVSGTNGVERHERSHPVVHANQQGVRSDFG